MTPSARLQMAIEILDGLERTAQPTDRFLRDWFRTRRFAGAKDRRAIAERVFAVQRRRAHFAHRLGGDAARALVIGALLEEKEDIDALFTGGYGPPPLTEEERAAIAATPGPAPDWVRGEYPGWLAPELRRAFGAGLEAEMIALQARAPVDLRVNRLKARRPDVLAALTAEGFAAAPTPFSPLGIRIPAGEGGAALSKSPLFESGAFEFQDEAAQIAALLAGARPGQRVLDLAAGAGGKALALAAQMDNAGEVLACDPRGGALVELEKRAARAGTSIIKTLPLSHGKPDGLFDLVFLDAPCSGTGTWRRQPELRWRLTPGRLAELTQIQDGLLDEAVRHIGPQGRLLYATCSLLPVENEDRVEAFLARNPAFRRREAAAAWEGGIPGLGRDFRASPAQTGTDGFFGAILCRE